MRKNYVLYFSTTSFVIISKEIVLALIEEIKKHQKRHFYIPIHQFVSIPFLKYLFSIIEINKDILDYQFCEEQVTTEYIYRLITEQLYKLYFCNSRCFGECKYHEENECIYLCIDKQFYQIINECDVNDFNLVISG